VVSCNSRWFRQATQVAGERAAYSALAVALNEHNLRASQNSTSAQVITLMRLAEPTVRLASPRVANGVESFRDCI
jgi:hypothetical protein